MPAIAALLAKWCPIVLGEELMLPTVPMYWCGDDDLQRYVLENLDKLEIRDSLKRFEYARIWKAGRSKEDNEKLAALIKSAGWKYVAIEPPEYSTAAVWNNDRIEPWPMVMRVFATLHEDRYSVLPGAWLDWLRRTIA